MMKKSLPAALIAVALGAGCVGPSRLSRGLDEKVNQMYVDNPGLTGLLSPFILIGVGGCWLIDYGLLNPFSFWGDVGNKQGTPYYYENPQVSPTDELTSSAVESYAPPSYRSGVEPVRPVAYSTGYTEHTVRPRETLRSIARDYYGDPNRWKEIHEANRSVIPDPNRVPANVVLRIPMR
ncbi:MAG: LysM peptidoglycan-binding domain-containing protein [Planctomycetes bacterium]|nr:LysM peptidoglycan-binding domain-containing protein [Planctomycetota bacterium]